ncbi:hypothetical protein [Streptomyces sp. NPDC056492]|uniref:hypothetical protein n=1 Tax=Streptomyces sp. NPDC056492 TaxID=3345838 RepID=UPI00369EEE65
MPLIKEFIAKHETVTNAAGDALRAPDAGDLSMARALVSDMTAVLRAHWKGEEDGLFPASLTALTGDEWDVSIQAWRTAHPGAVLHPAG